MPVVLFTGVMSQLPNQYSSGRVAAWPWHGIGLNENHLYIEYGEEKEEVLFSRARGGSLGQ